MTVCGAIIRPRLGPFRFRLRCTLRPNHEALGIPDHKWVKQFGRFDLEGTDG